MNIEQIIAKFFCRSHHINKKLWTSRQNKIKNYYFSFKSMLGTCSFWSSMLRVQKLPLYPKTEKKRKRLKQKQNIQELWDAYKRCNIRVMEITGGKKRETGTERIFEEIITENSLQINISYQITDSGSSENT